LQKTVGVAGFHEKKYIFYGVKTFEVLKYAINFARPLVL
jgi:hypothetical protein